MYQIGWFSTGRDEAAQDLLAAVQSSITGGEIEAEIAFVFCSREAGETEASDKFIRMVKGYQMPPVTFSYQRYKAARGIKDAGQEEALPAWRLDYDREVMARLRGFSPDLCVLVGYMLIVGREMCQKYNMINLHPAAPGGPAGTWQEVIWQLIESGAKETGVMMHLITPELDRGPVVTYGTFPIRGEPFDEYREEIKGFSLEKVKQEQGENNSLFKLIRQYGAARELPLITATIQAFSQGKIKISKEKKVIDAEGKAIKGYILTDEINQVTKESY